MRTVILLALAGVLGLAAGCNSSASDGEKSPMPDVDCSGTIPKYADVAIFRKCTMCHSSTLSGNGRMESPKTINFDTEAAADALAMQAVSVVKASEMPPSTSGITVTDEEKQGLYKWAMCTMK